MERKLPLLSLRRKHITNKESSSLLSQLMEDETPDHRVDEILEKSLCFNSIGHLIKRILYRRPARRRKIHRHRNTQPQLFTGSGRHTDGIGISPLSGHKNRVIVYETMHGGLRGKFGTALILLSEGEPVARQCQERFIRSERA